MYSENKYSQKKEQKRFQEISGNLEWWKKYTLKTVPL